MSDQWFVQVPITSDALQLASDAKAGLQAKYPGWTGTDPDLEVVLIDELAPMGQNAAEATSRVPPAVFRAFGQKLIGRTYQAGVPAIAVVTFTLADTLGHIIPAGTEIDIDGFAFAVNTDTPVASGSSSVTGVAVTATEPGIDFNGKVGTSVTLISALSFVSSVMVTSTSAGGLDAELDVDYQNNLSRDLLLQAKTLVTLRDYELWALKYAEVGRALAYNNGDRAVGVALAKVDGTVVSTLTKNAIIADYANYRLVNTVVTVIDPTYTTINVAYTVRALVGYDPVDLATRITAALNNLLSPANWAKPKFGDPGINTGWINEPIVRRNLIIDRIGDVEGVDYVYSVEITGSAGTVDGINQRSIIDFGGTVTGGTYTATVDGQTTAAINWNDTGATVVAKVEALSNVEPGDFVFISGGPGPTDMIFEFRGKYGRRAVTMTVTSSLTGTAPTVTITPSVTAVNGTGNLTMPGTIALPQPGTMTGSII